MQSYKYLEGLSRPGVSLVEAPRVKVGWSPDDAASISVDQTFVVVTIPTAYKRLSDARATTGAPVGLGGGLANEEAGASSG